MDLRKKSSKASIKTRSTPASFSFKAQATKHTIVNLKWSIITDVFISTVKRRRSRFVAFQINHSKSKQILLFSEREKLDS